LAATPLDVPPPELSTDNQLPVSPLPVEELVRISGFRTGEPYFGATGGNRFDAPGWRRSAPEFRTCYLGLTFNVALAESLLHDLVPVAGHSSGQ